MLTTVELQWNDASQKSAKAVSNLLRNRSFRDYLKQEVLKAFDGDYDALVSKVVKDYQGGNYNWNATQMQILANTSSSFPLMQIAVQVSPEQWNTNAIPNIVWMDAEWDEARKPQISGYDKNGNTIILDGRVTPNAPTVIISLNERGFIACDDLQYYRSNSICEGCPKPCQLGDDDSGGGGSGGGGTGGDLYPDLVKCTSVDLGTEGDSTEPIRWLRQEYLYESIFEMYFGNLSAVESWVNGAPEIKVWTFSQTEIDSSINERNYRAEFEPNKRKDIDKKWWNCGINQFHLWQYFKTGTEMKYAFLEHDETSIKEDTYYQVANYVANILDSSAYYSGATSGVVKAAFAVGGLAVKHINGSSEYIGEMLISARNGTIDFGIPTGQFRFMSQPF